MKNLFLIIFWLSAISCQLSADQVWAATVSSADLRQKPQEYDGETVVFQGEVIGDIMSRGEFAWVNLKDASGAIGIFCPQELLADIEYKGGYKYLGDTVSVKGVFHERCPQHGGDTDIHAEKITVVKKGMVLEHPLQPQKVQASIILPLIVFILAMIHLIVRKFRKP